MNVRVSSKALSLFISDVPLIRWTMISLCLGILLLSAGISCARPRLVVPSWRPAPPEAEGWTQRYFVDDAEPPPPTAEEKARGFMLHSRPSYMSLVYDNSVPHREDLAEKLTCTASIGEYESTTLAVYALCQLGPVSIQLDDLQLTGTDQRIPASQIEVHVAENQCVRLHLPDQPHPVDEWMGKHPVKEYVYMPRYLYPQADVDVNLQATQSAWFWITVHVPADAQPGTYTTNLTVSVAGQAKASLPVVVEVLPIQLDELVGYSTGYHVRTENPESSWTLEDRVRYMANYGSSSLHFHPTGNWKLQAGWTGSAFPVISLVEGKIHVAIAGSNFEEMMEAYTKAGFPNPPQMTFSGVVTQQLEKLGFTPDKSDYSPKSDYNAAYLAVLDALKAECERRGWQVPILSPADEIPSRRWRDHAKGIESPIFGISPVYLSLMKKAGFTTELNHFVAYAHKGWQNLCLPYLDTITPMYTTSGGPLRSHPSWDYCAEYARKHGLKLQTYNTLTPGSVQPTSFRFMGGWFYRTWGKDVTGDYFYIFDEHQGNPDNDLEPFRGDVGGGSYYAWRRPDPDKGLTGGPAIDAVALREGIDDMRYIVTLERLISEVGVLPEASARQAAALANRVLQRLIHSFDFENSPHLTDPVNGKAQSELMGQGTRDGLPIATGELLYRNGWSVEDYDKARDLMAQQILKLQDLSATNR